MSRIATALICGACLEFAAGAGARAGVTNPDISVIGQPFVRVTNDPADADGGRPRLDAGETEIVFDAYLNPYAKGFFALSLARDGMSLEEGYFTLLRGLPAGLELKGGRYRAGFGKLNPTHPHAWPFAQRFRVLAAFLPGEESFDETGVSLSGRLPSPGESSLTASLDWLQGDTFRRPRAATGAANDPLAGTADGDRAGASRPAGLARLNAFTMIGERSGLELGLSGTHGTNNVAAGARTTVLGADAKAKLWCSAQSYIVLQAEALKLTRDDAGWDPVTAAYTRDRVRPWGWYAFADWNVSPRWNVGGSYERFQRDDAARAWGRAVGLFAGLSLLEETTAFRVGWERYTAGAPVGDAAPAAVSTFTTRVIFSMGPHKAHQF